MTLQHFLSSESSIFQNKILKYGFQIAFALILLLSMLYANDIIRVTVVTLCALYLFTTEKLPVEITALLIMVVLMVFHLVTPSEGVSGFSNSATLTVLAMFVLSAGIQRTGLIHTIGRYVFRFAGNSELRQILAVCLIVGPISGFINNTAAVAIMLAMVLDLSGRSKTPATKLLIPLSYISMAGGMLTLIGTSTSILANSVLLDAGIPEIAIFEFTKLGAIILIISVLYFISIGRFLLPSRKATNEEGQTSNGNKFLAEILIEKDSPLIGKTLETSKFLDKYDAKVVKIIRGEQSYVKDADLKRLEEKDIVVLLADETRIVELDKNEKQKIKLLLDFDETMRRRSNGDSKIFKVLVKSRVIFEQRSLAEIDFWKKFRAAVVGVHREDVTSKRLADMKLKTGEILLLKASKRAMVDMRKSNNFVVMETLEEEFVPQKMWTAIGIVIGVIALAALGIFPIMVSALAGAILMILMKCLDADDLHESVSWNVIFLLAGVIPLGIAFQKSGAADYLANMVAMTADFLPPIIILGFFYLITTLLTEIISNNASVVLLIPVAISVAEKLDLNPMAFVFAVMFAASTSFLTPVGYQTNTMVYGAGNYKFSDFMKVGAPLNFILLIVTTSLIVYFWGL